MLRESLTSRQTRYRFRLVSISCDPAFIFSIDGHQLTVIEVEGQNVQPLLVDSLQIFVGAQISQIYFHCHTALIRSLTGQRYSVVVS
jgi:FtsP/CotA-like multicopper oxidase with cupredoxin domain